MPYRERVIDRTDMAIIAEPQQQNAMQQSLPVHGVLFAAPAATVIAQAGQNVTFKH